MRINAIEVNGFRCFSESRFEFHPNFNLIVGNNQAGKTSLLEALAVAAGAWMLGIRGLDKRNLTSVDVRLHPDYSKDGKTFQSFEEDQRTEVKAKGHVLGQDLVWSRDVKGRKGRTTSINAKKMIEVAEGAAECVRTGKNVILPLISYYGTGRLWQIPKDMQKSKPVKRQAELSRLEGYKNSLDKRCNPTDLIRWMRRQDWMAFQKHEQQPISIAVKKSVIQCLEAGRDIWFSPEYDTVLVEFDDQMVQRFETLSDGMRNMVSMIGDIAIKAAQLNPHLGEKSILETPGIVLIDELDLHLHPRWQRNIVNDLKRTFPKIQFICTTHSPQIIGEVLPNELMILDNGISHSPESSIGVDSNRILQELMNAPTRNETVQNQMDAISLLIDEESFEDARSKIELLKKTIGENDAEIVHFESIMTFLE